MALHSHPPPWADTRHGGPSGPPGIRLLLPFGGPKPAPEASVKRGASFRRRRLGWVPARPPPRSPTFKNVQATVPRVYMGSHSHPRRLPTAMHRAPGSASMCPRPPGTRHSGAMLRLLQQCASLPLRDRPRRRTPPGGHDHHPGLPPAPWHPHPGAMQHLVDEGIRPSAHA